MIIYHYYWLGSLEQTLKCPLCSPWWLWHHGTWLNVLCSLHSSHTNLPWAQPSPSPPHPLTWPKGDSIFCNAKEPSSYKSSFQGCWHAKGEIQTPGFFVTQTHLCPLLGSWTSVPVSWCTPLPAPPSSFAYTVCPQGTPDNHGVRVGIKRSASHLLSIWQSMFCKVESTSGILQIPSIPFL